MKKLIAGGLLLLAGCGGDGSTCRIAVYSGGKAVKTYNAYWPVDYCDGRCYFTEVGTGRHVKVSGTVTVEQGSIPVEAERSAQ